MRHRWKLDPQGWGKFAWLCLWNDVMGKLLGIRWWCPWCTRSSVKCSWQVTVMSLAWRQLCASWQLRSSFDQCTPLPLLLGLPRHLHDPLPLLILLTLRRLRASQPSCPFWFTCSSNNGSRHLWTWLWMYWSFWGRCLPWPPWYLASLLGARLIWSLA